MSINQSVSEPINQSINRSVNQSVSEPIIPINQSIDQSMPKTVKISPNFRNQIHRQLTSLLNKPRQPPGKTITECLRTQTSTSTTTKVHELTSMSVASPRGKTTKKDKVICFLSHSFASLFLYSRECYPKLSLIL